MKPSKSKRPAAAPATRFKLPKSWRLSPAPSGALVLPRQVLERVGFRGGDEFALSVRRLCNGERILLELLPRYRDKPTKKASASSKPSKPAITIFKTRTAKSAVAQFERLLADVAAGCVVEITENGKAVASMLSPSKLETLEILANPAAMKAIRAAQSGKRKFRERSDVKVELKSGRGKTKFRNGVKLAPDDGVPISTSEVKRALGGD